MYLQLYLKSVAASGSNKPGPEYAQGLERRRKGCFGRSGGSNMSRGMHDELLREWMTKKYFEKMGDINHGKDSNTCEAGNKAVSRVCPKDGSDHSRMLSFTQRVALVMAEANSPYPQALKFMVHADVLTRLTGHMGVHRARALERRSKHDARHAQIRQSPAARERRRNRQYANSNTLPPPLPPQLPEQSPAPAARAAPARQKAKRDESKSPNRPKKKGRQAAAATQRAHTTRAPAQKPRVLRSSAAKGPHKGKPAWKH